jgi:uncharacterized protein (DUF1330 family)
MPAYLIADVEVTDPAGYAEYTRAIVATVDAHGGRYLVRGGRSEVLEGDWTPRRLVVIEFPNAEALRAWYDSPEYAPLIDLRQRTANARLVMVDGV